jgi:PAS domain S-box-containing protein
MLIRTELSKMHNINKDTRNQNKNHQTKKDSNHYSDGKIIHFKLAPFIICIIDKSGRLLYINDKFTRWLGYSRNDVEGKNIFDLSFISPEDKLKIMDNLSQCSENKEIESYEFELFTKVDRIRFGKLYIVPFTEHQQSSSPRYLIMITDITQYKETEENLNKIQKKFRKKERCLKEELSDGVLNPLCVAKGYLHLLIKNEFSQQKSEEVSAIARAVDNIEKVVLRTMNK